MNKKALKIIGGIVLFPFAIFIAVSMFSYIKLLLRIFGWAIALVLAIRLFVKLFKYLKSKEEKETEKERDP